MIPARGGPLFPYLTLLLYDTLKTALPLQNFKAVENCESWVRELCGQL